jgi:hypothetical protein
MALAPSANHPKEPEQINTIKTADEYAIIRG